MLIAAILAVGAPKQKIVSQCKQICAVKDASFTYHPRGAMKLAGRDVVDDFGEVVLGEGIE